MKKFVVFIVIALLTVFSQVSALEITADALKLTDEQNNKLVELKQNLKAEVQPIWEEIESGRLRIEEIEKRYFEEFWNMLSEEQKKEFTKLNEKKN